MSSAAVGSLWLVFRSCCAAPQLAQVTGCTNAAPRTFDCANAGGFDITLTGKFFGAATGGVSVKVGTAACTNVAVVTPHTYVRSSLTPDPRCRARLGLPATASRPHPSGLAPRPLPCACFPHSLCCLTDLSPTRSAIKCRLAAGSGFNLLVTLTVRGQTAAAALVSYAGTADCRHPLGVLVFLFASAALRMAVREPRRVLRPSLWFIRASGVAFQAGSLLIPGRARTFVGAAARVVAGSTRTATDVQFRGEPPFSTRGVALVACPLLM